MLTLPQTIGDYFALPTNASLAALSRVLDEDIVVRDEHRTYEDLPPCETGVLTRWRARPSGPSNLCRRARRHCGGDRGSVGQFSRKPLMLDHRFSLRDARITALEIA